MPRVISRACRCLASNSRGVAAVEFALLSSLFMIFGLITLDFGLSFIARQRITSAVSQGELYAFDNYSNGQTIATSTITSYVQSVANLSAVTATVTCNGSTTCSGASSSCYCLTSAPVAYSLAATCSGTCADGSAPGYFLTIAASYSFQPLIAADTALVGTTISDSATVRLR
jgi:Flp pilus assembly protein TadG